MGKVYGYVRVSSTDQHEDRQFIAMTERGVPEVRTTRKTGGLLSPVRACYSLAPKGAGLNS